MRVVVVGLGIQGQKRLAIAGPDAVAKVDTVVSGADYQFLQDVPLSDYNAALVCTPDSEKIGLITYLLENGKHVLVEKPLLAPDEKTIEDLIATSKSSGAVCYTAYNHRFEPHFVRMQRLIASEALGKIYLCRMFYGNGTARDVRESPWRDRGTGVLPDLGSHLIDTTIYWFGKRNNDFEVWSADRFENRAFDHIAFGSRSAPVLEMEITLLSWRNHFTADIYGEYGSAHIESLCKWGPSVFTHRKRVLPSGRPTEESVTLVQTDPTWLAEYQHFKSICENGAGGNLVTDIAINSVLKELSEKALVSH